MNSRKRVEWGGLGGGSKRIRSSFFQKGLESFRTTVETSKMGEARTLYDTEDEKGEKKTKKKKKKDGSSL